MQVDGAEFVNTIECFNKLGESIRDTRYLGVIPADGIIVRRNPPPIINHAQEDVPAEVFVTEGAIAPATSFGMHYRPPRYTLPELEYSASTIGQRYHLEIGIEKFAANNVPLPLGDLFGLNIATFVGETSTTACESLVDRAMPVAAVRKIDFSAVQSGVELDIRLEHVALAQEQCVQYQRRTASSRGSAKSQRSWRRWRGTSRRAPSESGRTYRALFRRQSRPRGRRCR